MASSKIPEVGIIGAGWTGNVHARAYTRLRRHGSQGPAGARSRRVRGFLRETKGVAGVHVIVIDVAQHQWSEGGEATKIVIVP